MNFMKKFMFLLVQNRMSQTHEDIFDTCDRVMMNASLLLRFEVYFTCILIAYIHKTYIKENTILSFSCLIF